MKIHISNYSFHLSEPFRAGHVMTGAEARALNALRAENIRNNVARALGRKTNGGKLVLEGHELREFELFVQKYDQNYTFGQYNSVTRTGSPRVQDQRFRVAFERAYKANPHATLEELEQIAFESKDDPLIIEAANRREHLQERFAHRLWEQLGGGTAPPEPPKGQAVNPDDIFSSDQG